MFTVGSRVKVRTNRATATGTVVGLERENTLTPDYIVKVTDGGGRVYRKGDMLCVSVRQLQER